MRSGDDNSKLIVGESLRNRNNCDCYEGRGGYFKFIPKFYDAAKPGDPNFNEWINPLESAKENPINMKAWRASVSASYKALRLNSNIGKGVIFYNSDNDTQWDGRLQEITTSFVHNGIKGMWTNKEVKK
jgi:hypothetical protein